MSESSNIAKIRNKLGIPEGVDSKQIRITPELANFLLSFNLSNRPLSNERVNAYSKMMLKGNWELTNDMISFNSKGVLSNGQHRLHAVARSNVTSEFYLAFNIENTLAMDNGKTRSLTDNLALFDKCNPLLKTEKSVHQAVRSMLYICSGKHEIKYLAPSAIVDVINSLETELIELLNAGILAKSYGSKTSQSVIHASFILAYLEGVSLDVLVNIRQTLNTGFTTSELDYPVIALRDKLYLLSGSNRDTDVLRATYTQYCIQSVVKGSTSKTCRSGRFYYIHDFSNILD